MRKSACSMGYGNDGWSLFLCFTSLDLDAIVRIRSVAMEVLMIGESDINGLGYSREANSMQTTVINFICFIRVM